MKLVYASFSIESSFDGIEMLKRIERYGRTAYKSEAGITENSALKFVVGLISRGHESVLEHESVTAKVVCDRGVSHEIVRHRLASYTQESTRYCNYATKGDVNFISMLEFLPDLETFEIWLNCMHQCEIAYKELIRKGCSPQIARSVLPNSLKTEIVMTMNLREWRHFFKLRTAKDAHPQMRQIAISLLLELHERIPVVFDDIFKSIVNVERQD